MGDRPLARIARRMTVETRNKPAMIALHWLTVLNVLFTYARIMQEMGCRAARAFD